MKNLGALFQKYRHSDLIKNISTLIAGTAIAQLIPILLQPLLRRFYSPSIYGMYAVYMSAVGILFTITSLRYELAIIHPRKDKEAVNILVLSQFLNFIFSILLFVFILIFKSRIAAFLNIPPKYTLFLYLIPAGTFFYNLYQSFQYWLIRKRKFVAISANKFVRRGTEGSLQVFFKYIYIQTGLILGDITGHIANVITGFFQCKRSDLALRTVSAVKIKYVLKKYMEYPKYNMVSTFMKAFSYLMPAIFINKFFSTEYTGYFDLSKLVLSIPLSLIAGSIANVLLQRISEKFTIRTSIRKEMLFVLSTVLLISVVEVIIIKLFAVELFTLLFGKQWQISGEISEYLVWSYTLNFITVSFSSIYISMKKIKLLSIWQLIYFCAILLLILFRDLEFIRFIRLYVFIEVFCFILNLFLLLYIIIRYEKELRDLKS